MADDLTCYAYFDGSFEYIGPIEAERDPMDPENILWPRNTTTVQPPVYGGGTVPVYNLKTRKWSVQVDCRGQTWFTAEGMPVLITHAGDPTAFDPPLQQEAPPPPPTPEPVVTQVSAAQALIQLSRMAHDGSVVPGTDNLADATEQLVAVSGDRELKIWFARSTVWIITDPNVQKIGKAFNLTAEEIQAAFDAASKIGG